MGGYTEQEQQGMGSALKGRLGGFQPQLLSCIKHIFPSKMLALLSEDKIAEMDYRTK